MTAPRSSPAELAAVAAEAGCVITSALGANGTPTRCSCGWVEDLDDRARGLDTVVEHLYAAAAEADRYRPPSTVDGPPSTAEGKAS